MNKSSLINTEVLYEATMKFEENLKDDVVIISKIIAKFNALSNFITKERDEKIIVNETVLINRDNVLRNAVKKLFALNQTITSLTDKKLINKKIDRSNFRQCIDLIDSFWFSLWEIADRKNKDNQ